MENFLVIYYMICNICLFILFQLDKFQAKRHKQRISEKTLLLLGVLGGFGGGLLGMVSCRHKIRKLYFWLIFIVSAFCHLYLWSRFLV
ncbi:MAG: DUF1294 domain-containing protein [Bacillota bacterium]|jgi:uncharacterized membrane protein YsdA (DUF1294 family)